MWTNRPRLMGTLVGLTATLACILYFFAYDFEEKVELLAFDLRTRNCNTIEPTPSIVHLDIDDNSLERVGRWPWHRHEMAELLRALHELGPAHVMIDLLLSEYEKPVIDDPSLGPYSDVEPAPAVVGELSEANRYYGDLELADAIRTCGNVILAAHVEVLAPDRPPPLAQRVTECWKSLRSTKPGEILPALGLEDTPAHRQEVMRELLRARMREALMADFTLTEHELAQRLGVPLSEASAVIAGVKFRVALDRVAALLHDNPGASLAAALQALLGEKADRDNADRNDVLRAYRIQRGLDVVRRSLPPVPGGAGHLSAVTGALPPHFYLAQSARGVGAVYFSADPDGAVRRVPILIRQENRCIGHMGFAAAADILGLDLSRMELTGDQVLIVPSRRGATPLRVPLDAGGNLIIPWARTGARWRYGEDFPHISAAKLWAIVDARREMRNNQALINYHLADVVAVTKGKVRVSAAGGSEIRVEADNEYRRKVNQQLALERAAHLAALRRELPPERIAAMREESRRLAEEIEREQKLAISTTRMACAELAATPAEQMEQDPALKEDAARYQWALSLIDREIEELRAANARLEETIRRLRVELGPHIHDKYVFIGFAATAAGDIVATPIDPRTNGVMCHAHVLNGLLQKHFISRADRRIEIALTLLLGVAVAAVTGAREPRFSFFFTGGLMLLYAAVNCYVLFMRLGLWVVLVAPLISMFCTWAFVTLFRQLTAEREKRLFAKELGQYTSPLIAAKIAESPEAARAFKTVQTRDITCFFSDLKGFTTLVEEEDAELIQYVLNTYLQRMSQTIWSKRGLINKFIGDGIMAFFNPSVDPLPDHPLVACETSLLVLQELEKLKVEQAAHPAARIFNALEMRIGLARGLCKNGDMGSELKADYTVIGDVVNLAARLEPANKVFGTSIMVSGPVREAAGDDFEYRYLAELQVKGKAQTVPVYELMGRKGELDEPRLEYARRFEAGVDLYKARKWDECIVHYTRILARRPDDLGASRYIDACQELKQFPPDGNWCGALELKEK